MVEGLHFLKIQLLTRGEKEKKYKQTNKQNQLLELKNSLFFEMHVGMFMCVQEHVCVKGHVCEQVYMKDMGQL